MRTAIFRKSWKSCLSLTLNQSSDLKAEQMTIANSNREGHRSVTDMRVTITKCVDERLCYPSHAILAVPVEIIT